MIGALSPYISKIRRSYQSNDIIDRLNYQYTATIISLAAFTLAATQYVGKPIQCWVPPEYTGAWEKYAETYCFAKGSYFLPIDEEIDESYSQREKIQIGYYQWVPLVLAFMAIMFYLPSFIWKALNFNTDDECEKAGIDDEFCMRKHGEDGQISYYQWVPILLILQAFAFSAPSYFWRSFQDFTSINVKSILNNAAQVKKKFDKGSRSDQVQKAANHLLEALDMQRELKTNGSVNFLRAIGKRKGIYLIALYLFTKFLYVLNVVFQFIILNEFLGPQYSFWGFGILQDIMNGREWSESGHFPRVTLCDFNVRVLGNIHRWTVQCVLMINMFNEKIFIFLWFWFFFVGIMSVLSLIYWLFATTMGGWRKDFVMKYLRCTSAISENPSPREDELVNGFVSNLLRPDGVFLLRLIQTNGGDLLVGEIITALFNRYAAKVNEIEKPGSRAITESPNSTNL